jgi:hypothetical protein
VFVFATVLGMRLTGSLYSRPPRTSTSWAHWPVFRRLFEYIALPPQIADAPGARDLAMPGARSGSTPSSSPTLVPPAPPSTRSASMRTQDPAAELRAHGGADVAIGLAVDDRSFAAAYAGLRRGGRLVL